jgi:putative colanic acid biosynthesis acetyltransferase WcaB
MKLSRDPDFRMVKYLRSDWPVNRRNYRGLLILALYRIAHHAILRLKVTPFHTVFWGLYLIFYRFVTELILGCEIQAGAVIGKALSLDHGFSVVINRNAVIGSNCRLRHGVTIGCNVRPDGSQGRSPKVGNFVEFGANAVAVGGIEIGDRSKIAANSLVIEDVVEDTTVMGVPAKVISRARGIQ